MERTNHYSDREALEQLSTECLDEQLIRELRSQNVDAELVRMILDILWEREKHMRGIISPEIRERFEKVVNQEKYRR